MTVAITMTAATVAVEAGAGAAAPPLPGVAEVEDSVDQAAVVVVALHPTAAGVLSLRLVAVIVVVAGVVTGQAPSLRRL